MDGLGSIYGRDEQSSLYFSYLVFTVADCHVPIKKLARPQDDGAVYY
jgi:hypothetical protein